MIYLLHLLLASYWPSLGEVDDTVHFDNALIQGQCRFNYSCLMPTTCLNMPKHQCTLRNLPYQNKYLETSLKRLDVRHIGYIVVTDSLPFG